MFLPGNFYKRSTWSPHDDDDYNPCCTKHHSPSATSRSRMVNGMAFTTSPPSTSRCHWCHLCLSVLSSPHYSTTSHANWWLATSVMLINIIKGSTPSPMPTRGIAKYGDFGARLWLQNIRRGSVNIVKKNVRNFVVSKKQHAQKRPLSLQLLVS